MKKISSFFVLVFLLFFGVYNAAFALSDGMSINTLPDGQKVIIKEVHDNNIVKIDTWINTGSINEDDKTNGISHFLEHLFFKGTTKYPTGEFDKILDSKGANVNAATSKDFTHYYIQLPSKYFKTALELHADMLMNPLIPRKELERERLVVIEEISKTKDSPSNLLFDNMYEILFSKSNHPYKRNIIGKKEIIENVTREEILAYFNRFYTPDAYTTVIVGDVDTKDALKQVSEAFDWQNKKNIKQEKIKYPKVKPLEKIETKTDSMDITKTHMMIGFVAPKFADEKETLALDVLSSILTDGKSSILNQILKEKKQLVMSVTSGNYSQKDSGVFYITATFDPKNEQLVKNEILEQLKKIQNGELSDESVKRAKNLIKTDTYYSRESISNISNELGYIFTFTNNENYYDNYIKNIEKVTKKDVIQAAKKYLLLDKYGLSIVRPNGFKPVNDVAYAAEIKQPKLLETKDNTKKFLLDNGINLTTKNKKTNSIIAINIAISGSKAAEKKPATAILAAKTATKGTQNFTNTQLAEYLDENGIKLSLNSGNDTFSILIQTTKENLDKAFYVLDEVLNKPIFLDSEINKIKALKIQELKAISDNPSSFVFDEFKRLAYQGTIYGQNSKFILDNINKVTRDDVVEYYSRIIDPQNMNIAVVGDIDEEEIAQKFTELIPNNPKGTKFSFNKTSFSQFKPQKNVETTLFKNEVQANWMALGYKTCNINNRKDIAVLNVINAILGEGMSSRLFVKLREEEGLAYTVGSTIDTNILDGAFIAYIGTNAKSIEQAKNGILNQIEILKTEMVTTKELDDAKNKLMGQFLMSLETNMDEADLFSWYSVLGRNLDAFDEYKKMIMDVTQADIIEVANKYFSKPYIYTVVKKN